MNLFIAEAFHEHLGDLPKLVVFAGFLRFEDFVISADLRFPLRHLSRFLLEALWYGSKRRGPFASVTSAAGGNEVFCLVGVAFHDRLYVIAFEQNRFGWDRSPVAQRNSSRLKISKRIFMLIGERLLNVIAA